MPPLTSVFTNLFTGNRSTSSTNADPLPRTESPRAKPPAEPAAPEPTQSNGNGDVNSALPFKLPTKARPRGVIKGRNIDFHGVWYTVQFGEKILNDVALHEILDYVSAYDLEQYEHEQFREEARAQDAADEADREEALRRKAKRKERAKTNGTVFYESVDDSESTATSSDAPTGKHGRKGPTYTHLYAPTKARPVGKAGATLDKDLFTKDGKPRQRRRRRKRDPATGELLPLSGDEDEVEDEVAADPMALDSSDVDVPTPPATDNHQSGRQRTKTSFLQVAEPEKRRRRKRHPVTGELMPLGWKYDRNAPEERARSNAGNPPSMDQLSLRPEPSAKRVKLSDDSHSSPDPPKPRQITNREHIILSSDDSSEEADTKQTAKISPLQQFFSSSKAPAHPSSQPAATSSSKPKHQPALRKTMTSLQSPLIIEDSDEEAGSVNGAGWNINRIVSHDLSNPATHGKGWGSEKVILYEVEWEDGDLTWEPKQSFDDPSFVEDYHRRIGQSAEQILALHSGPRARLAAPREIVEESEPSEEEEEL